MMKALTVQHITKPVILGLSIALPSKLNLTQPNGGNQVGLLRFEVVDEKATSFQLIKTKAKEMP